MIKNVIFDLGQVLYAFKPKEYMLELGYSQEDVGQILGNSAAWELWREYDRGTYNRQSLIAEMAKLFPEKEEDIRKILSGGFIDGAIKIIPENVEFFYEVKGRGYKVYILSNIFDDGIARLVERDAFLADADGIIASAHHLTIKPEHKIYQILLDKYSLIPEECVFIDDLEANIAAAKELGIHGIRFTSLEDCKEQFESLVN